MDTTEADLSTGVGHAHGRIAIAASKPRDQSCSRMPIDYIAALRRAAGAPFVISTLEICDPEAAPDTDVIAELAPDEIAVLEWASGLLLTGGGDVEPAIYGQSPHPRTYNVSPQRDLFEFNLLDVALSRDMPVLAICRGMQVLNVHLGGTLEQHLSDSPGRLVHDRDRPRAEPAHDVRLADGSGLADVLGATVGVNSHHHQGLDVVAEPLEKVGYSEDGVLEAVESRTHTWVVGVQWHPEAMAPVDRKQLAIFEAFAAACRRYAELNSPARSA